MKKKRWVKPKVKEIVIEKENSLVFQACSKDGTDCVSCGLAGWTCTNHT